MDFRQFRDWTKTTNNNFIVAGIDNVRIELATNLYHME